MNPFVHSQLPNFRALIPHGARLVVGSSGGSDSQALLHILAQLKDELGIETIIALGIDHGLRPEAGQELNLAADLASKHQIDFYRLNIQLDGKDNLLAQAREKRYAAFQAFAQEHSATAILVAHTATDQAETMLMHLTRGTGLRGLGGMRPINGNILRPLLHLERGQLMEYLHGENIPYASDPSNESLERTRTNLRHQVLPLLKDLNPQFENQMWKLSQRLQADEDFLHNLARKYLTNAKGVLNSIKAQVLRELAAPLRMRIYQLWLEEHKMYYSAENLQELDSLVEQGNGSLSVSGRDIHVDRDHLWLPSQSLKEHDFSPGTQIALAPFNMALKSSILSEQNPKFSGNAACLEAVFDASLLPEKLSVGPWRQGDEIAPFGLSGHIKVGDLFTNFKIPKALREVWPIVRAGEEILWIPGLKRANTAPITAKSVNILKMQVVGEIPWHA